MLIKVGEKGERKGRQTFLTVIAHGNHTVTSFNIAKLEERRSGLSSLEATVIKMTSSCALDLAMLYM